MSKVDPIRDIGTLRRARRILAEDSSRIGRRRYLLFLIGINTGLRISDIVKLHVGDVRNGSIRIYEQKTGKHQDMPVSDSLMLEIRKLCKGMTDEDLIFPSRQRKGREFLPDDAPGTAKAKLRRKYYHRQPEGRRYISTRTAYNDLCEIAKKTGLTGHIGCHTLRKTFGYHSYQTEKNVAVLQEWFNHRDSNVTLRYIGVTDDQKRSYVNKVSDRLMI